jgi:hypothetical protein
MRAALDGYGEPSLVDDFSNSVAAVKVGDQRERQSASSPSQTRRRNLRHVMCDGEHALLRSARGSASTASPDDDRDGKEVGDQRAKAEPPRCVGGETGGDSELRHQPEERQADQKDHHIDEELIH